MGRGGHCLFQADQDNNILEYIQDHARELIGGEWALTPNQNIGGAAIILCQTDDGGRRVANLNTRKEQPKEMPDSVMRKHLDAGVAKQLIAKYRALSQGGNANMPGYQCYGQYMNIILAAHMMKLGANIDQDFKEYLRELVPTIPSRYGFQMTFADDGFRDPGKIQFLTALDNYKNGVPRVLGPSCWECGKTKAELGRSPAICNKCQEAHYCDRECQKKEWPKHKRICVKPGQGRNV